MTPGLVKPWFNFSFHLMTLYNEAGIYVCHGHNRHFLSLVCADCTINSVDVWVLLTTAVYAMAVSFVGQLLMSHQYFVPWSMQKACTVYVSSDRGLELNISSLFNKGCKIGLPTGLEMRSTGLERASFGNKSPTMRVTIQQKGFLWVFGVDLTPSPDLLLNWYLASTEDTSIVTSSDLFFLLDCCYVALEMKSLLATSMTIDP